MEDNDLENSILAILNMEWSEAIPQIFNNQCDTALLNAVCLEDF